MTTIRTMLLSTAIAGIVGVSALTGGAYAQSNGTSAQITGPTQPGAMPAGPQGPGGLGRGGVLPRLSCDAQAAGQLETSFAQSATQLSLTAEQQPLFDAYKTAALSAQTSFADACAKVQPQAAATGAPDMLTEMKNRQTVRTAEVEAVNSMLPSFEAFYNSLSDTQKAQLAPRRPGNHRGPDRMGRGRMGDADGAGPGQGFGFGPGGMRPGMMQPGGDDDGPGYDDDEGRGRHHRGFEGRGRHHRGEMGQNGPMAPGGFPAQPPAPPAPTAPGAPAPVAPVAPATAG